jgi:hypothetical protein
MIKARKQIGCFQSDRFVEDRKCNAVCTQHSKSDEYTTGSNQCRLLITVSFKSCDIFELVNIDFYRENYKIKEHIYFVTKS